jgi:hypothetical protein
MEGTKPQSSGLLKARTKRGRQKAVRGVTWKVRPKRQERAERRRLKKQMDRAKTSDHYYTLGISLFLGVNDGGHASYAEQCHSRRGRDVLSIAETFRWNSAGANPAWKSLASDQNVSSALRT